MIANCPGCTPAAADARQPTRPRSRLPWLGVLPAILYVLAPKCPMCLAAWLSVFGITFGMASWVLSALPPLAIASALLALAFAVRHSRGGGNPGTRSS